MSFSADKKPTARDFQQVALRCVTQAIQLPDMSMEELEASDPVRGVIPKTEEPVEVRASKWIVTEKSPKYPDEVSAQQAVAAAIESAVMLLPIEQLSTCEIEFSGQRITDIRNY